MKRRGMSRMAVAVLFAFLGNILHSAYAAQISEQTSELLLPVTSVNNDAPAISSETTTPIPKTSTDFLVNDAPLALPTPAASYYVSTTGSDAADGSQANPWHSIQYAVNRLAPGDTLYLLEGTYEESVTLGVSGTPDNPITIEGIGQVILDGTNLIPAAPPFPLNGYHEIIFDTGGQDYLTFRNLKIINAGGGIDVTAGSDHILIDGLKTDGARFGVEMTDAAFVTVQNSEAVNSWNGFHASGMSHDLLFENDTSYFSKDDYGGLDINYINGDGFGFEAQTANVTIRNAVSAYHWDSGFDIKANNVLVENAVSFGNKNGFKTWGQNITIQNSLIYGSLSQPRTNGTTIDGTGITVNQGTLNVVNSTIADTEAPNIIIHASNALTITDSIIARKQPGDLLLNLGTMTANNNFWFRQGQPDAGFVLPAGNFYADPQFQDWNNLNYQLAPGSPATGLGTDLPPATDPRPGPPPSSETILTGLSSGQVVNGNLFVELNPAAELDVWEIRYFIDGQAVGREFAAPFRLRGIAGFDTHLLNNGAHVLTALVLAKNQEIPPILIPFQVDYLLPPPDLMTGILNDQTLNGSVEVKPNLTANPGVTQVSYKIDGGAETVKTTSPFALNLDTTVLANGLHNLSGVVKMPSGDQSFTISFTVNNALFEETAGSLTMEGESSFGSTTVAGQNWQVTDAAGTISGGRGILAGPDLGHSINANITTQSPRADLKFKINTPGTYYVWIRGYAKDGGSDSLHVGLNGQLITGGTNVNGFLFDGSQSSWAYRNASNVRTSFTVSQAGEYTLNLWMREDGLLVDKIVLTQDANFTPQGLGPAESGRVVPNPVFNLTAGALLSGTVFIKPDLTVNPDIQSVAYVMDGNPPETTNVPPFTLGGDPGFDTETLSHGAHVLSGTVTTFNGSKPFAINFSVNQPASAITINSPQNNATLPSGTVSIDFSTQGLAIGGLAAPHLKFYLDSDPEPYFFYNGTVQEVLYQGQHTHAAHWHSSSGIELYGLSPAAHQVRFVAVDENNIEYANPEAQQTVSFTIAPPPPTNFILQSVATGLQFPVSMVFDPSGRVFYNELLTGKIQLMDPGFVLRPTPFYQLSILTGPDRGLLGIELDPDFSTNHYVYVYYAASDGANKVIRLTEAGGIGTDETLILGGIPQSPTHNGGNLHFGPDGKLYISIGDMGDPPAAQDFASLKGKMLRLNKDGSVPADNPFVGQAGARPEIWAYGFRNSFDFTFHPHTGDLWATENGPAGDDEINHVVRGGNYGWPAVTGTANNPNFIDPLVVLNPSVAPTGITAFHSSGAAYPSIYDDRLFFTEYNTGAIRSIQLTGPDLTELGGLDTIYGGGLGGLFHLSLGPDGAIYASNANSIYRLAIDNTPPAISAVTSTVITSTGATINWTTNEASDSQVQYRVQGTTPWLTTTLNTSLITNHSVALTGLNGSTVYEYQAKSKDAAGNLATQATIASFTTLTLPPSGDFVGVTAGATISGVVTIGPNLTLHPGIRKVAYYLGGTKSGKVYSSPFYWGGVNGNGTAGFDTNTLTGGNYTLSMIYTDATGDHSTSVSFIVNNTVDITAPVISAVTLTGIASTGATINWATNEPSDSQVQYRVQGTTTWLTTTLNTSLIINHSVVLAGLSASTVYEYQVKSKDAAGNLATQATISTFTTAVLDITPPVISAIGSTNVTSTGATINWTTNEASDSQAQYRVQGTTPWLTTTLNASLVTNHSVALTGLNASTVYEYQVKSKDAAGNLATQATISSLTTAAVPPPSGDFTGLTSGQTVSGIITVQPNLTLHPGIRKVFYYLNGTQSGKYYTAPFTWGGTGGFNTQTLSNGNYTLSGSYTDATGDHPFSIPFTVSNG